MPTVTVHFQIIDGVWDRTDPIERAAPRNLQVGILQELTVDWDTDRKAWHVWGGEENGYIWHGYGSAHDAAILDWLADRLAMKADSGEEPA